MEVIKSLYQDEINAYKTQVEELKAQNRRADDKNAALLDKVKDLQELIERADVANKDLHTAFEHMREENMKLQLQPVNQQNAIMDRNMGMEHEMALEQVRSQYINLTRESVSWISDKDRINQKVKFLERECQRYQRDNKTLGRQVRSLLKTLEEERGTIIRRANQVNEYGQQTVNASDIIDNHLVTFESIEELQQQNQKLLSLVKDLSERDEQREIQLENEDIRRLNLDIESLKSQLEGVKNDRERIISVFNTILKERDLFKILLCKTRQVEHMTPEIFQRMVSIACSAGPAITNEPESSQDKDAHITDLKAMISKLEQELAGSRSDHEVTRSRLEEELNLKTQLLEQAHLKILDESSQAEGFKERNQVLESNIAQLTAEYDELRVKAQKLTFEVEQIGKDKTELNQALEQEQQTKRQETDSHKETIDGLRTQIQRLTFNIEQLGRDKYELNQALDQEKQTKRQETDSYRETIDELRTRVQRLTFEVEQLRRDKIELASALDQEKQRSQFEMSGFLNQIQSMLVSKDKAQDQSMISKDETQDQSMISKDEAQDQSMISKDEAQDQSIPKSEDKVQDIDLSEFYRKMAEFQILRNFERARRLEAQYPLRSEEGVEEQAFEEKVIEPMVEEKVEEMVEEKVEDMVEEKVEEKVEEEVEEKIEEKIEEKVEEMVEEKVGEKVEDKVEEEVEEKIEEIVEEKIEEKLEEKVEEKVVEMVEEAIEQAVEQAVEQTVEEKPPTEKPDEAPPAKAIVLKRRKIT